MSKSFLPGAILLLLFAGGASADDTRNPKPGSDSSQLNLEQRQKMASLHDKMAACLRSEKPLADCRQEMWKSCKEMGKEGGCPMMGEHHGKMHGSWMHRDRMGGGTAAAEPPKDLISKDQAKSTVLKAFPGDVKFSELEEQPDGKWAYSFDVQARDKSLTEVWVDAKTGKILKQRVESAGEEARENHPH